ncbi:hypothetical protein [Spirosoma sp.]|uniref:hypothetical protein n=1 Tax=Spirosoma sp. TaxID=1899569 RepID=UPI003B3A0685
MRHPIEKYNQQQTEALAALPESQREWMARMFRIGNATYCYYNRAKDLAVFGNTEYTTETSVDLADWLEQQIDPQTENRSSRELLQVYFEEYLEGLPNEGRG